MKLLASIRQPADIGMGRLLEPAGNGRSRSMIEVVLTQWRYRTRLTDLLLIKTPDRKVGRFVCLLETLIIRKTT